MLASISADKWKSTGKAVFSLDLAPYGHEVTALASDRVMCSNIRLGQRRWVAFRDWMRVAMVVGEGSVAQMPNPRALINVPDMRKGLPASLNGHDARIWRPRWGFRLRNRTVHIAHEGSEWQVHAAGIAARTVWITDSNGMDLLRPGKRSVLVEDSLPADQLTLLHLLAVCHVAAPSSYLYRFVQSL